MTQQVRECLPNPKRKHAEFIDEISVAFAGVIKRVGRRRFPLYPASSMSAELFELRRIICICRMRWNIWGLIPLRKLHPQLDGRLRLLRETESLNAIGLAAVCCPPKCHPTQRIWARLRSMKALSFRFLLMAQMPRTSPMAPRRSISLSAPLSPSRIPTTLSGEPDASPPQRPRAPPRDIRKMQVMQNSAHAASSQLSPPPVPFRGLTVTRRMHFFPP